MRCILLLLLPLPTSLLPLAVTFSVISTFAVDVAVAGVVGVAGGWLGGKPNASKMRAKAKPKAKKRKN